MKIQNKIVPLSLILLFIVGIYGTSHQSSFSFDGEMSNRSQMNDISANSFSNNDLLNQKISSEVISGLTTLTTDADTYAPGDWVTITAESNTDDMNGSLEWRVESPISEVAFDFYSYYQDVFSDPEFNDLGILDWENDGFYVPTVPDGYMNLTKVADPDLNDVEVYHNNSALKVDSKYNVTFDYFSQGTNLLVNPSFETGDLTGWINSSNDVTIVDFAQNASDGDHYASINASEGCILNQTVSGWTGGRSLSFSARATGNTNENHWALRLEAYNSTGAILGTPNLISSLNRETDEKGYVTLILQLTLLPNTTAVKAIFEGIDGVNLEGNYTGRLDELILAENPSNLIFSNVEDSKWSYHTLTAGTQKWENATFQFETGSSLPNATKTLRFILEDSNSFADNKTSIWLIDNIAVNLVTKHEDIIGDPISNVEGTRSGHINSTWFHRGFRENLSSTFKIEIEKPENISLPVADTLATIKVQLPTHQVYFGTWIFIFKIHQVDSSHTNPVQTRTINISFIVEEKMNYVIQDYYLLRGSTNVTVGNDTIFTEYFEQETDLEMISPGDNITVIGYLEANSTPMEWYDINYLKIGSLYTDFLWQSNWKSGETITWSTFGFIPHNEDGESMLEGNFSAPYNTAKTIALNFQVPTRGIFGDISTNLTMSITGTNIKPDNIGGQPLIVEISIILPEVKFHVNVSDENLSGNTFWLTDYLGGNVTLEFININDTLETDFSSRNISSSIDIPMSDIDLLIYLGDSGAIVQDFHYHLIGNTVLWLDFIDPHIVLGTYSFNISWITAYSQNELSFSELAITPLAVTIQGTLTVVPPTSDISIHQGDVKTINFSVQLEETTKQIGGLDLIASLANNESEGNLIIYEQHGIYLIDLDIPLTMDAKEYTIEIKVVGQDDVIGTIAFDVLKEVIEPTGDNPFLDFIVSIGGFSIFILLGAAVVGLMFKFNKN